MTVCCVWELRLAKAQKEMGAGKMQLAAEAAAKGLAMATQNGENTSEGAGGQLKALAKEIAEAV
eukprot:COSAG05_NODE_11371_length_516_cov_3.088729_1_plen_63_part_01